MSSEQSVVSESSLSVVKVVAARDEYMYLVRLRGFLMWEWDAKYLPPSYIVLVAGLVIGCYAVVRARTFNVGCVGIIVQEGHGRWGRGEKTAE